MKDVRETGSAIGEVRKHEWRNDDQEHAGLDNTLTRLVPGPTRRTLPVPRRIFVRGLQSIVRLEIRRAGFPKGRRPSRRSSLLMLGDPSTAAPSPWRCLRRRHVQVIRSAEFPTSSAHTAEREAQGLFARTGGVGFAGRTLATAELARRTHGQQLPCASQCAMLGDVGASADSGSQRRCHLRGDVAGRQTRSSIERPAPLAWCEIGRASCRERVS